MSTKEILIKARAIISDEKNWTQGVKARDVEGNAVSSSTPTAVCFCSIGAVERAGAFSHAATRYYALRYLARASCDSGYPRISDFNDNSSHAEVLAMFDKAIANVD
jgi:hypothetical protein